MPGRGWGLPPLGRRPQGGRAPASDTRNKFKGAVAYTVRRLCDIGYEPSVARTIIADDLARIGVSPSRGSGHMSERTVRLWCEDVAADVGRHGAAARAYDSLVSDPRGAIFNSLVSTTAEKLLRSRLLHLARSVRASGKAT
jgi:hypothetical protein